MTALSLWLTAVVAFFAHELRWSAAALYDSADSYFHAAEHWQRCYLRAGARPEALIALANRDACLREGKKLVRKALRRMDWRML